MTLGTIKPERYTKLYRMMLVVKTDKCDSGLSAQFTKDVREVKKRGGNAEITNVKG